MSGDDVTSMQKQLVDMGYMSKTTGYYGDETKAAMKEFQSRNGLSADGLAGEKTYEMLYSPEAKESKSKAQKARTKANINKMIEVAKSKLGCRYVRGAKGPDKFDCSGFVYWCLKQAGVNQKYLTSSGWRSVSGYTKVSSISSLRRGDIIVFKGHVGIALGDGTMIDASSGNGKVVHRSCTGAWSQRNFICGWRIF